MHRTGEGRRRTPPIPWFRTCQRLLGTNRISGQPSGKRSRRPIRRTQHAKSPFPSQQRSSMDRIEVGYGQHPLGCFCPMSLGWTCNAMGISNVDEEGLSPANKLFGKLPSSPRRVNVSLCNPDSFLSFALLVSFRCWRLTVKPEVITKSRVSMKRDIDLIEQLTATIPAFKSSN